MFNLPSANSLIFMLKSDSTVFQPKDTDYSNKTSSIINLMSSMESIQNTINLLTGKINSAISSIDTISGWMVNLTKSWTNASSTVLINIPTITTTAPNTFSKVIQSCQNSSNNLLNSSTILTGIYYTSSEMLYCRKLQYFLDGFFNASHECWYQTTVQNSIGCNTVNRCLFGGDVQCLIGTAFTRFNNPDEDNPGYLQIYSDYTDSIYTTLNRYVSYKKNVVGYSTSAIYMYGPNGNIRNMGAKLLNGSQYVYINFCDNQSMDNVWISRSVGADLVIYTYGTYNSKLDCKVGYNICNNGWVYGGSSFPYAKYIRWLDTNLTNGGLCPCFDENFFTNKALKHNSVICMNVPTYIIGYSSDKIIGFSSTCSLKFVGPFTVLFSNNNSCQNVPIENLTAYVMHLNFMKRNDVQTITLKNLTLTSLIINSTISSTLCRSLSLSSCKCNYIYFTLLDNNETTLSWKSNFLLMNYVSVSSLYIDRHIASLSFSSNANQSIRWVLYQSKQNSANYKGFPASVSFSTYY